MFKTQVGLGILSIPGVFGKLGLIPGLLCLLLVAFATGWSNYIIGIFKMSHPEVYSIDDAGYKIAGQAGRIILGAAL